MKPNLDQNVVAGFGDEWRRFDQSALSEADLREMFDGYFAIFPWDDISHESVGFDLGCGSGRWAKLVAPEVGELHCVDASVQAVDVARKNLSDMRNCRFHVASVESIPIPDGTADFGYCLGVLHHVPNTAEGIKCCAMKLKPGAPFLIYLYYAFDNKPWWYRLIWKCSEVIRYPVSRAPFAIRYLLAQVIALTVYLPLARGALFLEKVGIGTESFPLSYYRKRSFYVMRTDALDRFGTRLEKRFTRDEIAKMMTEAGFAMVKFSESKPYWCALGYKKQESAPQDLPIKEGTVLR